MATFVAYFSTRLRDIYFAITTLIFSQIFYVIIFTWTSLTGGENGLTFDRPALAIPGLFSVAFIATTLVGPIVGAAFFLLLREGFSRLFTQQYLVPLGLSGLVGMSYLVPVRVIFIAMVIFLPQGLLGFARRWLNR